MWNTLKMLFSRNLNSKVMDIEKVRDYCLSFNKVTESFPFDETTLVFKVCGKMFALLSLDGDASLNLKNTPEKCTELRELYDAIVPGYHMNKTYWITIYLNLGLEEKLIKGLITDSYNAVCVKLPKYLRSSL